MTGTAAKKRRLNPVAIAVPKQLDAKSTIININIHSKKDKVSAENEINYNIENLLTEQGNLVLDYNELFTVEHQKEQMMLEIEQRKKEATKGTKQPEVKLPTTKDTDVMDDEDDEDDEEAEEDDEDDDEDDEDVDLDEDGKLPKDKTKNTEEVQPKKRVSVLKGKALVGKYDLEDPFIDDSEEVIVEASRKAKNEGVDFFVFFGDFQSKDLQR